MTEAYPKEFNEKIRNEVLNGKSKYKVARELGIADTTVYVHTIDLPSRKKRRPLSKELIHKIREEVIGGKSKYSVAKEIGISPNVIYVHQKSFGSV